MYVITSSPSLLVTASSVEALARSVTESVSRRSRTSDSGARAAWASFRAGSRELTAARAEPLSPDLGIFRVFSNRLGLHVQSAANECGQLPGRRDTGLRVYGFDVSVNCVVGNAELLRDLGIGTAPDQSDGDFHLGLREAEPRAKSFHQRKLRRVEFSPHNSDMSMRRSPQSPQSVIREIRLWSYATRPRSRTVTSRRNASSQPRVADQGRPTIVASSPRDSPSAARTPPGGIPFRPDRSTSWSST